MRFSTHVASVEDFCLALLQIPAGSLFRHNDAGDLPALGRPQRWLLTNREQGKTGKSYRSRTSRGSCPADCLIYPICYASVGPISWHWKALGKWFKRGAKAMDWRAVLEMAKATSHLVSWTYTHWDWRRYRKTLLRANALGMTINVSTEDPAEAVKAFRAGLPVTLVAPPTQRRPLDLDGIPGYICPALLQEGFTCDDCGNGSPLCARADRHFIVVFPAHGSRANKVWSLIKPLWEHWWSSRGEQPPC
ncbi:MAG: hypothetical protein KC503_17285 [Myxococcales bacterium]|nr:hypothetical protein [Myxococcales bacterium]